jgi:hypothetical protein
MVRRILRPKPLLELVCKSLPEGTQSPNLRPTRSLGEVQIIAIRIPENHAKFKLREVQVKSHKGHIYIYHRMALSKLVAADKGGQR